MRQAVLIAVLALMFAIGCATTDNRSTQNSTSDGEVTLPSTDAGEVDTLGDISEATASTVSMAPVETTNTTTTVANATNVSTTTIDPAAVPTTTATLFSERMATLELTTNMVVLINDATAACAEPLEFECSEAVWEVCEETKTFIINLREKGEIGKNNEGVYDVRYLICRSASSAQLSEFSTVLSAKYGIKFYEGNFAGFRGTDNTLSIHLSLDELSDSSQEKYPRISADTKEILMTLFNKILDFSNSSTYRIEPKDDEVNQIILSSFSITEEAANNAFCPAAVELYIANDDKWVNRADDCRQILCLSEETAIDRICFSDAEGELSSGDTSNVALYWKMIPSICANLEVKKSSYTRDDQCRQFANYICDIFRYTRSESYSSSRDDLEHISSAACALAMPIFLIPGEEALRLCLYAIRDARVSQNKMFDKTEDCSNTARSCVLRSKIAAHRDMCESLNGFYELEVMWKNLPEICTDQSAKTEDFTDSKCFSAIEEICNFDIVNSRLLPDYGYPIGVPNDLEARYDNLTSISCPIVYPENFRINNLGFSSIQRISNGPPSPAPVIRQEEVSTNLSQENYETLTLAANVCSDTLLTPLESNCASAVWNACYDLESTKATYEDRTVENSSSEVSRVASYICLASYFAELGEIIEAISLSYSDAYLVRNLNVFVNRIPDIIKYGRSFSFHFTERLYLKPRLLKDLSEKIKMHLSAFGDSLSTFFFRYIQASTESASSSI